jgi:hypothetical protein
MLKRIIKQFHLPIAITLSYVHTQSPIKRYYSGRMCYALLLIGFCLFSDSCFASDDHDDSEKNHLCPVKKTSYGLVAPAYTAWPAAPFPAITHPSSFGYNQRYGVNQTGLLFLMLSIFNHLNWLFIIAVFTGGFIGINRQLKHLKIKKELKKLALENEVKALRAQINPHFIQNTFDIVAERMQNGKADESVLMIKKVSSYFRQVLDKSEMVSLSLEDELEFTEEYIKIQQLIQPQLFTYSIQVGDDIDSFSLKVPSMLLQPVVENIIQHGFAGMITGGI